MLDNYGVTVVDTNLRNETVVRDNSTRERGVRVDIEYRYIISFHKHASALFSNMNIEQLRVLVAQNQCFQWIRYDCVRAPLR